MPTSSSCTPSGRRAHTFALATLLALVAATVTPSAQGPKPDAAAPDLSKVPVQTVWPPPPEAPRVRYVGVYTGVDDVNAARKPKSLSLKQALLGKDRVGTGAKNPTGFVRPFGVAVDGFGRIIVADTAQSAVFVVDVDGRHFYSIGASLKRAVFRSPVGLAVDSANNIYVGDSGLKQILVFGPDLGLRSTIGAPGELDAPSGLAIDEARQRLYAIDSRLHTLIVYNLSTGKLQARVGKRGDRDGEFNYPSGVAVGPDGRVYVSDTLNYRVEVFDQDLRFMRTFGSLGVGPGDFRRPKGIAVDADNVVYVADSDFNNFQMFTAEGQPLMWVGEYGERPGQMILPGGIAVDRARRRIFLCEQINRRVQVFERVGS
jgi:DNA-binding beta-propeller fold protein YncE